MITRRAKSLSIPIAAFALAGLALGAAVPAAAEDASVANRLDRAGLKYEVDGDGDYKLTFNYKAEGRSQLVFVSGKTETVAGMTIREVFSPAAKVEEDEITGRKALELLEESSANKIGSWEIRGGVLYFVIKVLDDINATQLSSMLDIAAETADNEEIKISGSKDAL